jgi:AcrR family transcriptional regulator
MAAGPRRDQLLDAAARLIVEQGFLPLPMEGLARAAQVSKALIYVHFPTQYDLYNALLARELESLGKTGLDGALKGTTLHTVALDAASIYFDHVAHWGPLLQILFSDRYLSGHYDRAVIVRRDAVMRRLAKLGRASMRMPMKEIVAGLNIIVAIPEEAGTLAFHGDVPMPLARDMCRTLTLSALKGLASNARR